MFRVYVVVILKVVQDCRYTGESVEDCAFLKKGMSPVMSINKIQFIPDLVVTFSSMNMR